MNSDNESLFSLLAPLVILVVLVYGFKSSILDANNIPSGSMIPTLKIGDYLFVNKMRFSFRFPHTEWEISRYDNPVRGNIITFIPPPPGDSGKNYVKRVMAEPGDLVRIRNIGICHLKGILDNEGDNTGSGDIQLLPDSRERDFTCNDREPPGKLYPQPVIAFVEYKKHGQGPWRHYPLRELGKKEAIKILSDADNVEVLHPRFRPGYLNQLNLPVLFEEKVGETTHLLVESANAVESHSVCANTSRGCTIPPDHYLVMGDNRDDSRDSRYLGFISREAILGKALIIYFSINWRDQLCAAYASTFETSAQEGLPLEGYRLKDFPPELQRSKCSDMDAMSMEESPFSYLYRTLFYRVARMSVRWSRIGNLLD